jgi:Omp85 superfamily domain
MRYAEVIAAVLICLTALPPYAGAQGSADFENLPIPQWAERVIDSFGRPLHPVIGSVASGGGIGFGVGYDSPADQRWYKDAEAMVSIYRYFGLEGEIGRRAMSKRAQIGAFAAVRHMNRLDYFGIGPSTVYDDRSSFRLRETAAGTRGFFHIVPALRLGGSVAMYKPDVGPGSRGGVPSVEEHFSAGSVPGLTAEPLFGRYRAFAEIVYPTLAADRQGADDLDRYRGTYQVAIEAVRDYDGGRHDFHRWETELQQRIPGFRAGQRLTLHGFVSGTNTGSDVPFYMLYALGGSSGLKSFRPNLIGTDGTQATLRAFKNFRFRDRDVLLMQAEYRIPIFSRLDATVFVDAGQVAPRTSDLFKWNELRTGTGFSLSYMHNGRPLGRVDVGFGGGEGVQLFWSFKAFD